MSKTGLEWLTMLNHGLQWLVMGSRVVHVVVSDPQVGVFVDHAFCLSGGRILLGNVLFRTMLIGP